MSHNGTEINSRLKYCKFEQFFLKTITQFVLSAKIAFMVDDYKLVWLIFHRDCLLFTIALTIIASPTNLILDRAIKNIFYEFQCELKSFFMN